MSSGEWDWSGWLEFDGSWEDLPFPGLEKVDKDGWAVISSVSGIDWEEEYRVEYERKVRGGGEAEEK